MKIDDLPPRDYWQMAQEDLEIASALQEARYRGERRADDEARQQRRDRERAAEREKRQQESLSKLKGQA